MSLVAGELRRLAGTKRDRLVVVERVEPCSWKLCRYGRHCVTVRDAVTAGQIDRRRLLPVVIEEEHAEGHS